MQKRSKNHPNHIFELTYIGSDLKPMENNRTEAIHEKPNKMPIIYTKTNSDMHEKNLFVVVP